MNDDDGVGGSGIVYGSHCEAKRSLARRMRREPTPAEARLWHALRGSQLGGCHFRRQQVIDGFIVDFYCHAAGLVAELDGGVHLSMGEYDAERAGILERRRLRVLRYSNDQVFRCLDRVLAEIRDVATARATAGNSGQ